MRNLIPAAQVQAVRNAMPTHLAPDQMNNCLPAALTGRARCASTVSACCLAGEGGRGRLNARTCRSRSTCRPRPAALSRRNFWIWYFQLGRPTEPPRSIRWMLSSMNDRNHSARMNLMKDVPTLRFVQPRAELRPYLHTIWIVESPFGLPQRDQLVVPNGCPRLILPYQNS